MDGNARWASRPLEDKIVQQAVKAVLRMHLRGGLPRVQLRVSARTRLPSGTGRAVGGSHDKKVNWMLDADIRGFFDAINHEWLIKFLEHRIADPPDASPAPEMAAGRASSEDGEWSETTVGTPQGAVISPLLANVFLHYVLDLWIVDWRKRQATGDVIVVRYADDFVIGFQHRVGGEALSRGTPRAVRQVRSGTAPGENPPDRVRPLCGGTASQAGRGPTGDVRLSRLHAHLRQDAEGSVHDPPQVDREDRCGPSCRRSRRRLLRRHARGQWRTRAAGCVRWSKGWFNYHAVPGNYPCLDQFRTEVAATVAYAPCVAAANAAAVGTGSVCNALHRAGSPTQESCIRIPTNDFTSRPKVRAV